MEAPNKELDPSDGAWLIRLARHAIATELGQIPANADAAALEAALEAPVFQAFRATFVTLTMDGQLRGCIGSLVARESLKANVRANALHAALRDPRFPPLQAGELPRVAIHVSVLTPPRPLVCTAGADLLARLTPGRDGVVIRHAGASATFLPQVWEQLRHPADFMSHLCLKAGLASDAWQKLPLAVETYRVQSFDEDIRSLDPPR